MDDRAIDTIIISYNYYVVGKNFQQKSMEKIKADERSTTVVLFFHYATTS